MSRASVMLVTVLSGLFMVACSSWPAASIEEAVLPDGVTPLVYAFPDSLELQGLFSTRRRYHVVRQDDGSLGPGSVASEPSYRVDMGMLESLLRESAPIGEFEAFGDASLRATIDPSGVCSFKVVNVEPDRAALLSRKSGGRAYVSASIMGTPDVGTALVTADYDVAPEGALRIELSEYTDSSHATMIKFTATPNTVVVIDDGGGFEVMAGTIVDG